MRTLLLFRGAPGCGKSTFIENMGLKPYALSPDELCIMHCSPELGIDGKEHISQTNNKVVWDTMFTILENRMKAGEFTVIDATNSKTSEMNQYKNLAKQYRYRIYIVDMTDLPIEECKKRNTEREAYRQVPEEVIDNMYARFATQKIPSGITVLKPLEIDKIFYDPIDMNQWKKIHIIGDIHGCNTCLQKYLGEMKDDEYYIFCGDYIDRGPENVDVVKFLMTLIEKRNVLMIEGNHERWLNLYAHGEEVKSPEFVNNTAPQLAEAGIDFKDIRRLYSHFSQCAYFTYQENVYFVCHGGVSSLKLNPLFIATEQMIKGVGKYTDMFAVTESWRDNTLSNHYQIFGHRNIEHRPIDVGNRCYCLEGGIESGGCLRAVELSHDEPVKCVEVKNEVFIQPKNETVDLSDVAGVVQEMRNSQLIVESKLTDYLSSFNFTREAFYKRDWNALNCKARGLFIDVNKNKVFARGYHKFFNINEVSDTQIENLNDSLEYPVNAYVKYNGFLGLLAYDSYTDDLAFMSKSKMYRTDKDVYPKLFKDIFYASTTAAIREDIKRFLKITDYTLVFEVIDPVNDPHIIKYDRPQIILLDCIVNILEDKKLPYRILEYIGASYHFNVKQLYKTFDDWNSLYGWIMDVSENDVIVNGEHIEGFVIESSNGFMTKLKLPYYKEWKFMRSVSHTVANIGYLEKTSCLTNALENYFYGFVKKLYETNPERLKDANIIDLRDEFYTLKDQC